MTKTAFMTIIAVNDKYRPQARIKEVFIRKYVNGRDVVQINQQLDTKIIRFSTEIYIYI